MCSTITMVSCLPNDKGYAEDCWNYKVFLNGEEIE